MHERKDIEVGANRTGIAVAREVKRRDPDAMVTFVGTATGVEAKVVPREGFPLDLIRVAGLKGKSIGDLVKGLALLPLAARGVVPVRIAGRAPLVEAATVYQRGSSESGSRGRWLLVP